ncbi:DNA-3-methyladenine glycosylase family protein [Baekduia alba]|uniref:DNA-3-methyladenine glycosylase family protein n=1 Tax=Baekduia alba TaxID=2997333 RepID=UPI00233FBD07|nr:AlkA N-terminal domain-containing protein [Baekduia alba]
MRAQLATTAPFDGRAVLAFLAARAIPGVEVVEGDTYRRTLALPGGPAVVALTVAATGDAVTLSGRLTDPADRPTAVAIARALFGLDQDPGAVRHGLGADAILGPLVRARPGLRVPGAASGFEVAVRAILGQQISVAAARVLAGRITERLGEELADTGDPALTRLLPTPEALAAAPADAFPMPRSRIRTLQGLGAADPPLTAPAQAADLIDLWGVGPWTAAYVALRLGDPDVFLPTDVAILKALGLLGATTADAPRWAPLRSFATLHLWASLANPSASAPRSGGVQQRTG